MRTRTYGRSTGNWGIEHNGIVVERAQWCSQLIVLNCVKNADNGYDTPEYLPHWIWF